jgi:hypothetical protein
LVITKTHPNGAETFKVSADETNQKYIEKEDGKERLFVKISEENISRIHNQKYRRRNPKRNNGCYFGVQNKELNNPVKRNKKN